MSNQREAERPDQIVTIAVVGDVHDQWDRDDEHALKKMGVDLVLLVGDFGNEAVNLVRSIANLSIPKAAILGNHDAWYTATDWGRSKCPYDRTVEDRVQQQLDALGAAHVGYGNLDLPHLGLSVVGARPFSWGGSTWKNEEFYRDRYGVTSFQESIDKIVGAAQQTTSDTIIYLGHCGPIGLGDRPEDPCGKDWQPLGGDHGDPDFEAAIAQTRDLGKTIPLVAFGHMHHQLRHTKLQLRRPVHVDAQGTVYVNAAYVPRIIPTEEDCLRNFTIVTLKNGVVFQVALVWLNQDLAIQSKQIFHQQPFPVEEEVEELAST
ncbi:MAG: TIGR04168 family protein [Oculatellaceae cyanobacterium bins.114]|nr:TIGR04168 family protein [Oculatellaceae cyanobacterium bins.114]